MRCWIDGRHSTGKAAVSRRAARPVPAGETGPATTAAEGAAAAAEAAVPAPRGAATQPRTRAPGTTASRSVIISTERAAAPGPPKDPGVTTGTAVYMRTSAILRSARASTVWTSIPKLATTRRNRECLERSRDDKLTVKTIFITAATFIFLCHIGNNSFCGFLSLWSETIRMSNMPTVLNLSVA
jgi:hypothetical protein